MHYPFKLEQGNSFQLLWYAAPSCGGHLNWHQDKQDSDVTFIRLMFLTQFNSSKHNQADMSQDDKLNGTNPLSTDNLGVLYAYWNVSTSKKRYILCANRFREGMYTVMWPGIRC